MAADNAAAPPSGGSKLVLILTLVNLVACIGMAAILVLSFKKQSQQPSLQDIQASAPAAEGGDAHGEKGKEGHGDGKDGGKSAKKADFGKMLQLEQFNVNLTTPGGQAQRFVRVNVSLELPTDDVENEVSQKMPQVRNAIIDLFNSKRASDLATTEGREFLKEEIRSALNSFITTGKVKGVYFTNFVVSG